MNRIVLTALFFASTAYATEPEFIKTAKINAALHAAVVAACPQVIGVSLEGSGLIWYEGKTTDACKAAAEAALKSFDPTKIQ